MRVQTLILGFKGLSYLKKQHSTLKSRQLRTLKQSGLSGFLLGRFHGNGQLKNGLSFCPSALWRTHRYSACTTIIQQ